MPSVNELLEKILNAIESGGSTLPSGGPFVVEDQAYVPTSSSGITVNNFNSVTFAGTPLSTTNDFYTNPVTALALVTDPLPDGNYTIQVNFGFGVSGFFDTFAGNIWTDGIESDIKEFRQRLSSGQDSPFVGVEAPLIINDGLNQPHTIELKFGRANGVGNDEAQVWYANVRLQSEV
jgi:hypothetical protein